MINYQYRIFNYEDKGSDKNIINIDALNFLANKGWRVSAILTDRQMLLEKEMTPLELFKGKNGRN